MRRNQQHIDMEKAIRKDYDKRLWVSEDKEYLLTSCRICGLRYDRNKHKTCPSCLKKIKGDK